MKIEARFVAKAPETIDRLDWLKITHGAIVLRISLADEGLRLSLDDRLGDQLAVFPHATNTIALYAKRKKSWEKKRTPVSPAKSMRIEVRGSTKVKKAIEAVERLSITHGTFVLEVVLSGTGGLRLRLDEPLGDQLVVFPYALNIIALYATREDGK